MDNYADSVMTLPKALQQRDEARAQLDVLLREIERLHAERARVPDADAARFRYIVEYNWIGAKTRCSEGIQDGDLESARRAVDRAIAAAPSQPKDAGEVES